MLVNTIWSFVGRFGYLIINLFANIILARILGPEVFGQMAIILFFITIASVLTESGLSGALVRAENVIESDYFTVFVFNLFVSLILYIIIISCSSLISNFYNISNLRDLIVVSCLVIIINAFKITQSTKLIREMKFKKKYIYEIVSIGIASLVGVFLALNGWGIWSLVLMQIVNSLILTVMLWVTLGRLKVYNFDFKYFKSIYKFGVNTTLASLINTIFDNIYQLILAKYFSISQTGLYYQGRKLQEIPVGILQSTVLNVVYSGLSKIKNDLIGFNELYTAVVKLFTIILSLMCVLIYLYADIIILNLYGDAWIESIIYLRLLIIAGFFYLQEMLNRLIFKIFDRTEKILQLEIIKKIIQSITIVYGVWHMSILYLLYGFILTSVLSFFINYYYARKIQGYFSYDDLKCIFLNIVLSVLLVLVFNSVKIYFDLNQFILIFIIPVVLLFYFLGLIFLKVLEIRDIVKLKKMLFR
ncbi:lipopolysaccharide biosynthesis protein [Acinetobacter sp. ANC 4945]|nr:lipopolysaccharide biosynthesis protein [Acinetobacter amyesii]MCL6247800.1 lipopolysaccharide biosynthesis protein [Acinetobacter amyesii]